MAAPPSPLPLPAAALCPLCRGFLRRPVSIPCGHHFCRSCLELRWELTSTTFSCPRCHQKSSPGSVRPSRELEKVLQIARRLSRGEILGIEEEEDEEEGCGKHREPLEVFCREDGAALCAICRESRAHRGHGVLPLPEALREFRAQLEAGLQTLKEDRDKLLQLREAEMRRNWEVLTKTQTERQKILSQSQSLHLLLEEHSCHLLSLLGHLERDIGKLQEDNVTSLTQEISRLETRVEELQEKLRQPDRTFLQDISSTLTSLGKENFQLPSSPPPELERKIRRFREKNVLLEEIWRSFQDILMFELPEKMTVTLDPSTAHPRLRVSPDGGSVTWESGRDTAGDKAGHGWDSGTGQDTLGDRLGHELDIRTGRDTLGDRFGPKNGTGDRFGPELDTRSDQDILGDRFGPELDTRTSQEPLGDKFGPELDIRTGWDTLGDRFGHELDTGTGRDTLGDRLGHELDIRTGRDTLGDRLGHELDTGTGQDLLGDRLGPENGTGDRFGPKTGPDPLGDRFGHELDTGSGQDTPGDRFGPANGTGDRFGPETRPDPLGDRFGPEWDIRTGQEPLGDKSGPENGSGIRFGPKLDTGTGQEPLGDRAGHDLDTGTSQDLLGDRFGHEWDSGTGQDTLGDRLGPEWDTRSGQDTLGDKSGPANGSGDRLGHEWDTRSGPDPAAPDPVTDPAVLGRQAVTSGRHCWDVQVSPAGSWALGVARVSPQGDSATPGWELWSLGQCQGQFWALSSLQRIPLSPIGVPNVVRVALDYERGQVAFFDGDRRRLMFVFPEVAFEGTRVHPWFLVWGQGARLALCP